jgi:hypothetical protein
LGTVILTLAAATGYAQDDFFSNLDIPLSDDTSPSSPLTLLGWVTQELSYSYEQPDAPFSRTDREFSQAETSLFIQFDWKASDSLNFRFSGKAYHDAIYEIQDGTPYSRSERNEFRDRYEVKDFYLEKQFDNGLYLKLGNQIQAWGFAEYLRVTDLINTEDQYAFGQQDLEDLRLQVPAAQLSYSLNNWVLDGVITYRAGYHDMAPAGDEFDQLLPLRRANWQIDRQDPDNQLETFLRASTHYSSGDVQIVAGEFNDNRLSLDGIAGIESLSPVFQLTQQRMQALGVAANHVNGSWLVFGELGLHRNAPVIPDIDQLFARPDGWANRDQVLGALGVEYNGFSNTLVSFEVDNVRTQGNVRSLGIDNNQLSYGTRVYWTGWNERLELLSVFNRLDDGEGYLTRFSLDYNWSDNWKFGLLWVDYSAERDSLFHGFRNNDMVQFNARFSFQN